MPATYPLGVVKVLGILLIAGGIVALAYRGFTYTRESSTATLGPIAVTVNDERRVAVPVWVGVVAVAAGAGLLLVPVKNSR